MYKPLLRFALFFAALPAAFSQEKNFIDQPYIEVSGHADTLIVPNEIFIRIVLSERDTKDRVSVEEQENKLVTALKSLNINTEQNLSTSDMLSNYRVYLFKGKEILKTKEYVLKVSDAATASKVFVKLEDLDISNASILRVNHTALENIKNGCRSKAIANAHTKALALTKPIGQNIGAAIHIADFETFNEQMLLGRVAGMSANSYYTKDKLNYDEPKIDFEKINVTADVNVKFVLK
jgi:hypothetical protein